VPKHSDIEKLTANQIVVFLEKVQLFPTPLTASQSRTMGETYSLSTSHNVELSSRYFEIALAAKDQSAYPSAADLLGAVGRMKFVRPLYQQLTAVDPKLSWETFQKNRDFYHPICRDMVEKDFKKSRA
jgi:leukotriene-A4 hydrolase